MDNTFSGSVVFVTGGAAGIGRATCDLFDAMGAKVAILDVNCQDVPAHWVATTGDVTRDGDIAAAVGAVEAAHGRLDILVNNAGVDFFGGIEDGSIDDWFRVIDINLISVARVTRAALPLLRKSDHPAIVNLASCLGRTGIKKRALYSATKGGVEALTRAMAADLLDERIRVNCVNPGTVNTDFVKRVSQKSGVAMDTLAARQVTGQMVEPDEVAHAIAYLARPGATATVGTVLSVEAGFGPIRI